MKHLSRSYCSLGTLLPAITKPIWQKRGLNESRLFHEWALIAGEELAQDSHPEKIASLPSGTVLTLRVSSAAALEVQHMLPVLLSRINAYFGHVVISQLTLKQGVIRRPSPPKTPPLRALAGEELLPLHHQVAEIENTDLQAQLLRLGVAIKQRRT